MLGLISISVEFYLQFGYFSDGQHHVVSGDATVTVAVSVALFHTSVSLTVHKEFAGADSDPTFDQLVTLNDWDAYCAAFA